MRIGPGVLRRGFQVAQALHGHVQPGRVHHQEHRRQATVGFADEPAFGLLEAHLAGGAALDAHLLLDAVAEDRVASTVRQDLGHDGQRQAPRAGRRIGQAAQHQVHDVVGEVLVAAADEDLLARHLHGHAVGRFALGVGACAHQAQVAAGLGFGQVHGGQPFAARHLLQVQRLQRRRAVALDDLVGAVQQPGVHGPGMVGRGQHLEQRRVQQLWQALAAGSGAQASAGQPPCTKAA
jgi:hypothetical protein